ncbi:hypothetical protein V5F40_21575 [Xanthobacter sp. DSM 14520]|uniref:hypothetical protein n=1 Tax=Xanthobacter autotrophicus (strain ATCC BAA-1158 / Py2) TaxID=78245 RepID=UPI003728BBBF
MDGTGHRLRDEETGFAARDVESSAVFDHLLLPLRRVVRAGAQSDEAATRRALDIVGLFDPRVLAATGDVLKAFRDGQTEALL